MGVVHDSQHAAGHGACKCSLMMDDIGFPRGLMLCLVFSGNGGAEIIEIQ